MIDEDRELLDRLRRAVAAGDVRLELDLKHLSHIHSPVGSEAEANLFLYPGIVLAGLAWWQLDWRFAVGIAVVTIAVYLTLGRVWSRRRLHARVHAKALGDLARWRKLWKWGGIVLVRESAEGPVRCAGPQQSWHKFAASLG